MQVPRDFADTRSAPLNVVRLQFGPPAGAETDDDWTLLRLVACVAAATLLLAVATSLAG